MKDKIKRITRKILVYIGILTVSVCILKGINGLVFKSSISKKYENSYWHGKWDSAEHGFVSGKMIANLPNDLPTNDTILNVDILVYYNIWSLYNIGGTREFKLTGSISRESGSNGLSEPTAEQSNEKSFSFKASGFGESGQAIEYNGVINIKNDKIIGGYKSGNPNDVGNFILEKI